MTFREADRIIKADGWYLRRVNGSHHIYYHRTKPGRVVIANHGSKDIAPGTLKSILLQAGLNKEENRNDC